MLSLHLESCKLREVKFHVSFQQPTACGPCASLYCAAHRAYYVYVWAATLESAVTKTWVRCLVSPVLFMLYFSPCESLRGRVTWICTRGRFLSVRQFLFDEGVMKNSWVSVKLSSEAPEVWCRGALVDKSFSVQNMKEVGYIQSSIQTRNLTHIFSQHSDPVHRNKRALVLLRVSIWKDWY